MKIPFNTRIRAVPRFCKDCIAVPRQTNKTIANNEVIDSDFIVTNVTAESIIIPRKRLRLPTRRPWRLARTPIDIASPRGFFWEKTPRKSCAPPNALAGETTRRTREAIADRKQTHASRSMKSSPSRFSATPTAPMIRNKYSTPARKVDPELTDQAAEQSRKTANVIERKPPLRRYNQYREPR